MIRHSVGVHVVDDWIFSSSGTDIHTFTYTHTYTHTDTPNTASPTRPFFLLFVFVVASESSFFRDVIRNTAASSMCGCRDKPTLLPHLCNHCRLRLFAPGGPPRQHTHIPKKKKSYSGLNKKSKRHKNSTIFCHPWANKKRASFEEWYQWSFSSCQQKKK